MSKPNVLIQLDPDNPPSSFDQVVAIDSGADHVLSYGGVTEQTVQDLVHGAIFTRGPKDLNHTAIFIGGKNVRDAEVLFEAVKSHLLPDYGLKVSILFDANGCNTTAAAAVKAASDHTPLADAKAIILAGTGPVGERVALLLAGHGADVKLSSRRLNRAQEAAARIQEKAPDAKIDPIQIQNNEELGTALQDRELVFATGAAGITLLPQSVRSSCSNLKVLIDLNAVPPVGIEGVDLSDRGKEREGLICYGALGVGGLKMKLHKAAVARLFDSNDQILDAQEIYALTQN